MIDRVQIENFRSIKSARLERVARVNLIAGSNASGKTSILEAVFLAAGNNAELALRLRRWRGLGDKVAFSMNPADFNLFDDLFFDRLSTKSDVAITCRSGESTVRALRVEYKPAKSSVSVSSKKSNATAVSLPFRFAWRTSRGENLVQVPEIVDGALRLEPVSNMISSVFLASSNLSTPAEVAERYSNLSVRGEHTQVVEAIKSLFPSIQDLSVEIAMGEVLVHAAVHGVKEKVPLGLVSSGINKLVHVLVSIAFARDGIVLIDEMENGLHYATLGSVWDAVCGFARQYGTQLFVTTHSRELLAAAISADRAHLNEVAFYRATRSNGETTIESFTGSELAGALESGFEVRA